MYQRMLSLNEQSSQGSFVPQRHKDILSEAIGTPEPHGRTRGLGNLAPWGKYFRGDSQEAKREKKRAKAERMKEEIINSVKADFEAQIRAMEARLSASHVDEAWVTQSSGARCSSCTSAPDDASSPLDHLAGPARCIMKVQFATTNFAMDAAYGEVYPSPPGKACIYIPWFMYLFRLWTHL